MTEAAVPDRVQKALSKISGDKTMNDAMTAVMERSGEFASPMAAKLTGVALNDKARAHFDAELDRMFLEAKPGSRVPEIIIGGGLHAAIYAAVRVAEGHPKPLVIEASERVGGTFAVSRRDTFFLNSRNRPGGLGTPGRDEALNVLPGAPIQPASLSGDEYQPNSSLAFAIRSTLAMSAKVIAGHRVVDTDATTVMLEGGKQIKAARVISATGLGEPQAPDALDGKHAVTYLQFLAMLDQPFPMRGVKRVAVVGSGDAGKTVIEALVGQGPRMGWSVTALDYVESIDWYGVPASCLTKEGWEANNRSRYKGIARVLPILSAAGQPMPSRVTPLERRAEEVGVGFGGASVDGARYDLVIWATGFDAGDVADAMEYKIGGRVVARMRPENAMFIVGPAAQISEAAEANVPSTVPENTAALFRYADRTATLAMSLPTLELPEKSAPASIRRPPVPKKTLQTLAKRRDYY